MVNQLLIVSVFEILNCYSFWFGEKKINTHFYYVACLL